MIKVSMSKEISLSPYELLEEFKYLTAGHQIIFLNQLINHIYENSSDYHRAAISDWSDHKKEDWLDCEKKLKEMLEKDYTETDKDKQFFELFDISASAKTIEK